MTIAEEILRALLIERFGPLSKVAPERYSRPPVPMASTTAWPVGPDTPAQQAARRRVLAEMDDEPRQAAA